MPSNTTYNPQRIGDFSKYALTFDSQGVASNIAANATTNIDLLLTDDVLITGGWFVSNGGAFGDHASFQVLDTSTGTYSLALTGTATPYAVLSQFVTNWYPPASASEQFDMEYPAKISAGMTLRLAYTSVGLLTGPFIAMNYKLHKCMV